MVAGVNAVGRDEVTTPEAANQVAIPRELPDRVEKAFPAVADRTQHSAPQMLTGIWAG